MNSQMAPEMDSRMASAMASQMAPKTDLFDNVWKLPLMTPGLGCSKEAPSSVLTIKKVPHPTSQTLLTKIAKNWRWIFGCGRAQGWQPNHIETSLNVKGDNLGNFTIEITADTAILREIANMYAQIVDAEAKRDEEASAYLEGDEFHNGIRIYRCVD